MILSPSSILKSPWSWDRPLALNGQAHSVQFKEVAQVRQFSEFGFSDFEVRVNDPDSHSQPEFSRDGQGLDLDASAWLDGDEMSGMQMIHKGIVHDSVHFRIRRVWRRKPYCSVRLWFIEPSGFGTAASIYRSIHDESQLLALWTEFCYNRDVHLVRPDPSSPRHPADVHVLLSRNVFGAIDILVDVFVEDVRETRMTARIWGDTVRDIFLAAGYSRWLQNPRWDFSLVDSGSTWQVDEVVQLSQGAFVTLHIRPNLYEEEMSESQISTDCPTDLVSENSDNDGMSLLQFLDSTLDNPTAVHGWFGESPCQFDRWCGFQNNHASDSHNQWGPMQLSTNLKTQLYECRNEDPTALVAQPPGFADMEALQRHGDDISEDEDFEWVRLNGGNQMDLHLQAMDVPIGDSLLVVSFGLKDDDKGRRDGQLQVLTLQGLRQLVWELWQDEVEQHGIVQVFAVAPQPLQELGLRQALVLLVVLDGERRDGDRSLVPTLNIMMHREDELARSVQAEFFRSPISYHDLLQGQHGHEECEPYGHRLCSMWHAGDRVFEHRPCHLGAGGLNKLVISQLPWLFHQIVRSMLGYESFVRHARADARRYGNRVTLVISSPDQDPVSVESMDLDLLRPVNLMNHHIVGRFVNQGVLQYPDNPKPSN